MVTEIVKQDVFCNLVSNTKFNKWTSLGIINKKIWLKFLSGILAIDKYTIILKSVAKIVRDKLFINSSHDIIELRLLSHSLGNFNHKCQ